MIEMPLTQGEVALIDDEDFELVSAHKWCARWENHTKSFYALTNIRKPDGKWTLLGMHRLIMNAQHGEQVDHIHHLTLDNRKSELRLCTRSQNQHNRGISTNNASGFKGVSWQDNRNKWQAHICLAGKHKYLGLYSTPEEGHAAYCAASKLYHGEFGRIA